MFYLASSQDKLSPTGQSIRKVSGRLTSQESLPLPSQCYGHRSHPWTPYFSKLCLPWKSGLVTKSMIVCPFGWIPNSHNIIWDKIS